jgi:hypothetical protein
MSRKAKRQAKRQAQAQAQRAPAATPAPEEALDARGLSARELVFVDAFFAHRFNASAAARVAYVCEAPGSASSLGYTVRTRPHVAAEIERRLQAAALGAAEVVALLSDHARADMGRYLQQDGERLTFDLEAMRADGATHLLKRLKVGDDGAFVVELHDSQAALDKLARVHGLYKDQIKVEAELTLDDLATLAQRLDDLEASRGSG